jgi:hypothetical protein
MLQSVPRSTVSNDENGAFTAHTVQETFDPADDIMRAFAVRERFIDKVLPGLA